MLAGHGLAAALSIAAGFAVAAVAIVSSRPATGNGADETCISCHVDTFNRGLSRRYQHPPFFDHGCPICHLPDATGIPQQETPDEPATLTGQVASQEPAWARRRVFPSASTQTSDHLVAISDLSPDATYRFRIVLGEAADRSGDTTSRSVWLTLAPEEVAAAGGHEVVLASPAFAESGDEVDGSVTLSFLGPDALYVRWRTTRPLFGWLELERTQPAAVTESPEGGGNATATRRPGPGLPDTHPVLREPEDVAIDLCYSCHPAMGTSHPVRVYAGGGDIRIPDDLPTVNGGMITCVTCHDPHGADGKNLVRETIKTKLCVACHYKFRGTSKATMF